MSTLFLFHMYLTVILIRWAIFFHVAVVCLSAYDCMHGWSQQYQYKTADRGQSFSDKGSVTQFMLDILPQYCSETCSGKSHKSAQWRNLLERVWSSLMTTFLENLWIISHVHDSCSLSIPCPLVWVCCHPVSFSVPPLRVTSLERELTGNHSGLAKRCSTMVVTIHLEISLQLEV